MLLPERFGVDISRYLQTDLQSQYQSEAQQDLGWIRLGLGFRNLNDPNWPLQSICYYAMPYSTAFCVLLNWQTHFKIWLEN